jgi:NHLM bacteriocin system ABC transporter ATP-binding protein
MNAPTRSAKLAGGTESIAWVKQHLGDRVESIPVQGDRPLLLDDPSCAYVILSEHHQLFCVGYRDGEADGRREHLTMCEPGQLILGLQPATRPGSSETTALLLSGVSGSVVWRIPLAALLSLGVGDRELRVLAELIDRWILLLIAALPPSLLPTRRRELSAGDKVEQPGGAPLCGAAGGVVWIAPSATPRVYRGIDIVLIGNVADAWPLTSDAWALCDSGGTGFRVWSTEQLLHASGRAEFALGFSAFVAAVVSGRREQLASRRLLRDLASLRAEAQHTAGALAELAQVGIDRAPLRFASGRRGSDGFELACQRIFAALRLDPWPELTPPRGAGLPEIQVALSNLSGVRTRSVLLAGDWWQADSGPLLGFMIDAPDAAQTVHPVALLPRPRGGYSRYDPRDGSTAVVDEGAAQSLHPRAHQFYRSFPSQALSALDVLRFAAQGCRTDLTRILVLGLATGMVATGLPLLTGQVFDTIIPGAERGLLWQLMAVLLSFFAGSWLFDLARGYAMIRAQTRMDASVEAGTWDRLLSLPAPFFRKYSAGDLASRAEGIGSIREVLAGVGLSTLLSGVFSIWSFVLLFFYDVKLALAATGLVAISATVAAVATYSELHLQRAVSELDGRLSGLSLQLLGGIAKLRGSGSENRAFAVWAQLFARRRDIEMAGGRINVRIAAFEAFYPLVCSMALFWLIAGERNVAMTTGDFLAFSAAFGMFMRAVLGVIGAVLQTVQLVPLYERARPILTSPIETRGTGETRVDLKGGLELSHVSFRYEEGGPLILDDVVLRIEPGEFVAVVGPSGSGKSTLLRIMLGFDAPSEGAVFYDGQALAGMDMRRVRQQIGVVLQHSTVMAGSIYSNIVGSSGRSLDEAWRAAEQAAVAEDIAAMPMGMHTVLAQGGGTLSGGQRQRLLIARALASSPRILFFDEATSALDNRTQAAVSESLDQLRVTRVVIAHRLSTIRHADRIVVLEQGRIRQQGTFDALLSEGGTFAAMARRQMV